MNDINIADEWRKIQCAKRIVVKVGTSTLTHRTGNLNLPRMEKLVRQLVDLKNQGREILLVTSAAVGAGMSRMNIKTKPRTIADRQALAAIGQGILMHIYEKLFSEYGAVVAQVLLTKDDVADRQRYLNARTTIRQIISFGAVPVINENDTVSFDQIQFGDNDTLSAMVAGLVDSDLLVLLSDVDGFYPEDPRKNAKATPIPVVREITPEVEALAGGAGSMLGSGGMKTKIAAARIAISQGIPMVLAGGDRDDCLAFLSSDEGGHSSEKERRESERESTRESTLESEQESNREREGFDHGGRFKGTLFLPKPHALGNRKGWLAFSTRPSGTVLIDDGASKAILENGKSLLPSGVIRVEGDFLRGEVVDIRNATETVARGVVNYCSGDICRIMGRQSREIESILGPGYDQEVIHRDNLSPWR